MIVYCHIGGGYRPVTISDEVAGALGLRSGARLSIEEAERIRALALSAHIAIGEAEAIAARGFDEGPQTVRGIW